MPARKRRVIQRAIEEENDETERDMGRYDGQRDLEKLYNALEENGLVMRTNMDGIQISPILSDLLKILTDIRNDMNGNTLPAEIEIPFPVVSEIDASDLCILEHKRNAPPRS